MPRATSATFAALTGSLFVLLVPLSIAGTLFGSSAANAAGPPNRDSACTGVSGVARGLCNAFCDAQECATHRRLSCDQLRNAFQKQTGASVFPCEQQPVPTATPGTQPSAPSTPISTATTASTPTPCAAAGGGLSMTVAGKYPSRSRGALPFGTANFTDSAAILVMPFDARTNHESLLTVSRIQDPNLDSDRPVIVTHWSYWSANGQHLADTFVCLTRNDTVTVDPTNIQGELQNGGVNVKTGPIIDLTGFRGIVVVTAFAADQNSLAGTTCQVDTSGDTTIGTILDGEIAGTWGIFDAAAGVGIGHDALGLDTNGVRDLDPSILDPAAGGSIVIPTLNPSSLARSEVVLIGLESSDISGNGRFAGIEVGPINLTESGPGADVCCSATFTDVVEVATALPDVCFAGTGFAAMSENAAAVGDTALIPASTSVNTAGFVTLRNCLTADPQNPANLVPIGQNAAQFLFVFHGEVLF